MRVESAIFALFEHIAVGIDTQEQHGLECLAPDMRSMGEAMVEQDWARLDAARVEFLKLQREAEITRQALNALGLTHAVLAQCHFYRGYSDGPAHQVGVKTILRQAEEVLKRGEQCE